eukprot:GGOE01002202.1.p1 GENE.GGOE01002202.1~~GGOE01002202.1.p1  ORF type:complete len:804 (-),score=250.55 GGOE01002202.1:507-2879(-)
MEEYEKLYRIGSGGQGKILRVRHRKTGVQSACKMILCKDNYEMNFALREIKMLMDLRHEHIIGYKDFFIHKDRYDDLHVCLVMELCEQGDVSKRIRDAKRRHLRFDEARLVKWATQLGSALEYIHGQDILHRDLKPTNVFFTGEDDVKIGDFGLSTAITATGRRTVVGTPYYFAPELMLQQKYDSKVDMWGLGIVLMELCTLRERPINGQVLNNPRVVNELEEELLQQHYSPELAALVKALLDREPECRPSAPDVLRHLVMCKSLQELSRCESVPSLPTREEEHSATAKALKPVEAFPDPSCSSGRKGAPCPAPPRDPRPATGRARHGVKYGVHQGTGAGPEGKFKAGPPWLQALVPTTHADLPFGRALGRPPSHAPAVSLAAKGKGQPVESGAEKENIAPRPNQLLVPPPLTLRDVVPVKEKAGCCTWRVPEAVQSISAALLAAQDGDEVLVAGGVYRESLLIDKSVFIRGVGHVLVEVEGTTAIAISAPTGALENIFVRQLRALVSSEGGGNGKFVGVDIRAGKFSLEGCDVESHSGACIAIHGPDARPTIRRCTIHDGRQAGVYVFDGGQGVIEDNDIVNNEYAGILLKRRGNPVLRRNTIRNGKETGVFVCHESSGLLEGNDISGNQGSGVVVKGGGCPTILRNQIHDNRQAGIFCCDRGSGTIKENDIYGNSKAGVLVKTAGNPSLISNTIHGGKETGVYVFDGGEGCLQGNHIFENQNAGVLVTTGGNPQLIGNRIERNRYEGVWVCKGGQGRLEGNDLRGNLKGALDIQEECRPHVHLVDNVM